MRLLRTLPMALVALMPLCALAESTWVGNDDYLKGAIHDCTAAGSDRTACRHFTGEALVRLFGIGDFCSESRCLKAVIAVQNSGDRGQIGIIMPGVAVPSGKWGLNVPIAVAARVDRPEASFYGKGINWLFSDPAQVTVYVRL